MTDNKQIKIRDEYDIAKPSQLADMAKVLKQHIVNNKLYANIAGKNYVMVEGWQFAGGLLGLYPRIREIESIGSEGEYKYKAIADLVNKQGVVLGTGFAVCSNKESKKKGFDEYAVLSMAQTRAIGKAYRNIIGYVMKMSGYESTPADEVTATEDTVQEVEKKAEAVGSSVKDACEKLAKAKDNHELAKIWSKLKLEQRQDDEVQAYKEELKAKLTVPANENTDVR